MISTTFLPGVTSAILARPHYREEALTPEDRRRKGLTKVAIGIGLVVLVIVFTIIIAPMYYG
jgi:hypothetical protein